MKKIYTFNRRLRRKRRVRSSIIGDAKKPRVTVFRSNRYIYAQAIDDHKRMTICAASSLNLPKTNKIMKKEAARLVGISLAKELKKAGVAQAIFDRGIYQYHGRVASLANGLREGGIKI